MRGSAFVAKPHVMANITTKDIVGGVSFDVFDTLAKHHGITYQVKYSADWVTMNQDGSLGGCMGDVRKKT